MEQRLVDEMVAAIRAEPVTGLSASLTLVAEAFSAMGIRQHVLSLDDQEREDVLFAVDDYVQRVDANPFRQESERGRGVRLVGVKQKFTA